MQRTSAAAIAIVILAGIYLLTVMEGEMFRDYHGLNVAQRKDMLQAMGAQASGSVDEPRYLRTIAVPAAETVVSRHAFQNPWNITKEQILNEYENELDSEVTYGYALFSDYDRNLSSQNNKMYVSSGNLMIVKYAPSTFYLKNNDSAGNADVIVNYGVPGDVPIVGDRTWQHVTTIGVYDPNTGTFYLKNSNTGGTSDITVQFGPGGNDFVPVTGDWNGGGTDTIGVYQKSTGTFYLKDSNTGGAADITVQFGPGGNDYLPLTGDWNGDGTDTIGVYQKSTGTFYLKDSNTGGAADITVQFGPGGNDFVPVTGDWNGDGTDTIGVYQKSTGTFYLKNSNSAGNADVTFQFGPGGSAYVPLAGDWTGQGNTTVGIYTSEAFDLMQNHTTMFYPDRIQAVKGDFISGQYVIGMPWGNESDTEYNYSMGLPNNIEQLVVAAREVWNRSVEDWINMSGIDNPFSGGWEIAADYLNSTHDSGDWYSPGNGLEVGAFPTGDVGYNDSTGWDHDSIVFYGWHKASERYPWNQMPADLQNEGNEISKRIVQHTWNYANNTFSPPEWGGSSYGNFTDINGNVQEIIEWSLNGTSNVQVVGGYDKALNTSSST